MEKFNNNNLFFKIWRNIIIRNEIILHLRLFNKHYNKLFSFKLKDFINYKYKSYLNTIKLSIKKTLVKAMIPNNIKAIKFFEDFNQPIEIGVLPSTIKYLEFGDLFNQSLIGNWLPFNIEYLKFGEKFNQSIQKINFPKSLKSLIIPNKIIIG
ncbi:hypothetical protein ACTFIY_011461 [Dictyostelium cf. discoideum]